MMRRAGAEAPAAGGSLRLDVQIDDASRTGSGRFEAMVRAVDADLSKPECVDEERLLLARITDRQHRAKKAARPNVLGDLRRRPRSPGVAALFDHLEEQSGRMPRPQVLRAEPFLDAAVGGPMPFEVFLPEWNRPGRHGIAGARELAGTGTARFARVREARGDGTDVGIAIAVIEVVDGDVSVHQHGLLDEPLPENLGEEIDILLRAAGAERDVVNAPNETVHGLLQVLTPRQVRAATLDCSSARTSRAPSTIAASFA